MMVPRRVALTGVLAGVLACIVLYSLSKWAAIAGADEGRTLGLWVSVLVFWMLLEDLVFSRFGVYPIYEEHNLFPFEIAILWVLGSVPLLAGIVAGACSRRLRMR